MDGFSVSVDLSSFFSDLRSKSLIYVDTGSMKTIACVENHIKTLFGINVDICMFSKIFFLPSMEDVRVLRNCDTIKVEAVSGNDQDEGRSHKQVDRNVRRKPSTENNNAEDDSHQYEHRPDNSSFTRKKKHKKKRADNEGGSDAYLGSQSDTIQNSPSSVPENLTGEVEVKKTKNSKPSSTFHITGETFKQNDENVHGAVERPVLLNGSTETQATGVCKLHGSEHFIESPSSQKGKTCTVEGSDVVCDTSSVEDKTDTLNETPSLSDIGPLESDVDSVTQPPNKGRKRKRNRPPKAKREREKRRITDAQVEAPTIASPKFLQPNYYSSEPLAKKKNHIYFPDVDQPMSEKIKERLVDEHAIRKESVEEAVAQTTCLENIDKSSDDKASEKLSFQETVEKAASQENTEKEGTVEDLSGRNSLVGKKQISSRSQRRPLAKVSGGIGKLLSLLKSDSPPVFDRPKPVCNVASTRNETSRTSSTPGSGISDKPVQSVVPMLGSSSGNNTENTAARSCSPGSTTSKTSTPPKFIPKPNSRISFKILKMSPSYTPEVSGSIIAVVEKITPENEHVTLRLICGAEECIQPKGKFDLDESEPVDEIPPETIQLNWAELIEPTECQ